MLSAKKRNWIEILLHIAFWVGVYYTLTSLTSSHIHMRLKTNTLSVDQYQMTSISPHMFVTLAFLAILFYGNIFWLFKKIIRYKNGVTRLVISTGWFIVIFAANYFIVGMLFNDTQANMAIHPPHTTFRGITNGVPTTTAPMAPPRIDVINFEVNTWQHLQLIMLLIFLTILGISIAYFFLKEWAKSELVHTQLQANQLSTEIKFLKSQVNPHFLFNTLNNLFSMAQGKGNDELADGISKLSGMMRYMIYESNEDSVPIRKEIEYLQNCIVLNKLRYADEEAKVTFDYPDNTEGIFIAPMLFIPFVENAFKHGVSIGHTSAITISISVLSNELIFNCENTIYKHAESIDDDSSGIGLKNVTRRLDLVYPGRHNLTIKKDDRKYWVTLKINLA